MRTRSMLEGALAASARALWPLASRLNRLLPEGRFVPRWAPGPLPKSRERTFPPLGFPRETDSLCPECIKDLRARVLAAIEADAGPAVLEELRSGRPGEVRATIREAAGSIVMEKTCPAHGRFEDVMSVDVEFLPGKDGRALDREAEEDRGAAALVPSRAPP